MTMTDTRPRRGSRLPLVITGLVLAVVLILAGVGALVFWLAFKPQTQDFSYASTVPAGSTVSVTAKDVDVDLRPATDGRVHIRADGTYRSSTRPRFDAHEGPDGAVIDALCNTTGMFTSCDIAVEIDLPVGNAVTVVDTDGVLSAESMTGRVSLATTNADVHASGLTGDATLRTTNGGIDAGGLRSATLAATTSNGDVTVGFATPPGTVTAGSSNGSVTVTVPGTASYDVRPSTTNGRTTVSVPTDSASSRVVTATTTNGDVAVEAS